MGGLISGILGGGSSAGQEAQMAGLRQSRQGIEKYRPELMQAHLNVLSQMQQAYQPMNNALETMYGGRGRAKPPTIGDVPPPSGGAPPQQPPQQAQPQRPPAPRAQGGGAVSPGSFFLDPLGIFR